MAERKRVAAVCYRKVGAQVEVLLVRTTLGERWTFPKGGIDLSDTSPAEAARREALEEAGVTGLIENEALCSYRHLAAIGGGFFKEQEVVAYLLKVTGTGGAGEPGRHPKWWPLSQAYAALAENHPVAVSVEDLHRVLDAASARLERAGVEAPAAWIYDGGR